jgi:endonuclease YncB( thermonuclease family)
MPSALPALLSIMLIPLLATQLAAEPEFTPGGQAEISEVVDAATIALADGRKLRLAGIEVPTRGTLARQAKAAVIEILSGGTIDLRVAGNPSDRQGRVLAQVYVGSLWVQAELVRRGLARVRGAPDSRVGIADLLKFERQARRYHRGVWSDRAYAVLTADDAARSAGTFQLVGFTAAEIVNTSGQIYVRSDADRSAFALTIAPAAVKLCRESGLDPMELKGKRLLVRGFIDGSQRPTIAITYPEQIEILSLPKKKAPKKSPGP